METSSFIRLMGFISLCIITLFSKTSVAAVQLVGKITPDFQGSQMDFIANDGLFLVSNNSGFAFGFQTTPGDVTLFFLVVKHQTSSKIIWSANRGSPVQNSDKFLLNKDGILLQKGGTDVWKEDTKGKSVSAMELQNSGNLVLLGDDDEVIWQSFSNPTDTLISNQDFVEGMKLMSDKDPYNMSYVLEIKSGDMILFANFPTPQPYWSMEKEQRKTINQDGRMVASASLIANSWKFYDKNKTLLWQFIFSDNKDENATWIATLGTKATISFFNLQSEGSSGVPASTTIPGDQCSTPESCGPYFLCSDNNRCQCPSVLSDRKCKTGIDSSPCKSKAPTDLVSGGDALDYFALDYVPSMLKTNLSTCRTSCLNNCSCLALFFHNSTGGCFMFDSVGSFRNSAQASGYVSYIKVLSDGESGSNAGLSGSKKREIAIIVVIVISTIFVIIGLLYGGLRYYRKKNQLPQSPPESSEEDNFLESLSGMPIRFSYKDLQTATNNFSVKLGQGGFGSVYEGVLSDGTRLAVKKLEGIGQGKKEFRAEVSIIGSIHHHHLVRLRGYCAEGTHRLLAYEFMANGSLEKWIFKRKDFQLDWQTRFNVAVGTAKGLAYLHEDCDAKIVHCDIKPENVLLDDNFQAKVSDFGLAKLMTREQSHVFTTLRGTRGYLAPEWITNYAISEKSDVYSYGMVLLEIIGGRKNYDPSQNSEKSHFPSYAFKMMEEGKLRDILDSTLSIDEHDERVDIAIKVALWCIQEDMHLRPPMTKVVQMLEGISTVSEPPASTQLGFRLYSSIFKSISEEGTATGTSSGPSDCNSDAYLSAVRLSGPR